ncbi:hypothetical protein Pcinc_012001 [Petrolisthes cinctipes]|uniref:Uncharacterized protein n=1 Tax=Petrolisthes cinctipes TaxID=88211 RepID=A0AAE1G200_PETCI|nr:hypothetical protein Pcinc_012001 [Petrolisthes cinctipes]
MAQEQADGLFSHSSLSAWTRQEGRPLEETFLRNLALTNYTHLLSQLWYALSELNPALAAFLQPHLQTSEVVDRSPTTTGHLDSDPDTNTSHASAHHLDLYPLPTDYPYGLCIIFNVRSFIEPSAAHDQIPLTRRHGSEVDCTRLSATFKLFGFHVMTYIDPDLHMLESIFLKLRTKPEIALVSCLAICFMTHGDEYDNLYLHDRSYVGITYLRRLCFTSALINKPRLFFIQACRGEQALRPILLQQDVCTVTHAESDCLISLATVQGYTAVRSQTEGSWYVSEVCAALQECGHVVPVRTVLQRARTSLSARIDTMDGGFVTMLSEEKVTLTRYVQLKRAPEMYFVEGIMDLVMMEVVEQLIEQALEQAEGEQEQEEALAPSLAALQLNS